MGEVRVYPSFFFFLSSYGKLCYFIPLLCTLSLSLSLTLSTLWPPFPLTISTLPPKQREEGVQDLLHYWCRLGLEQKINRKMSEFYLSALAAFESSSIDEQVRQKRGEALFVSTTIHLSSIDG